MEPEPTDRLADPLEAPWKIPVAASSEAVALIRAFCPIAIVTSPLPNVNWLIPVAKEEASAVIRLPAAITMLLLPVESSP
ncbi:hypothetical protein GCM10007094_39150 [Pseudovibrio japonicus]|uniref:Uncharacterized protein n=1 Tax=Pseudovibrio japonicus TaxID=366534 RepID=A0ABQ3ETB3_9HYPH|nr:hypothetical protein GCM10007094_39150 [Pseudovibrio japonicus]